jgi:hypothetical protein
MPGLPRDLRERRVGWICRPWRHDASRRGGVVASRTTTVRVGNKTSAQVRLGRFVYAKHASGKNVPG